MKSPFSRYGAVHHRSGLAERGIRRKGHVANVVIVAVDGG